LVVVRRLGLIEIQFYNVVFKEFVIRLKVIVLVIVAFLVLVTFLILVPVLVILVIVLAVAALLAGVVVGYGREASQDRLVMRDLGKKGTDVH
jgi:hypothetical protein